MRLKDDTISVDRMDHADREHMASIAIARAKDRTDAGRTFYGWAMLTAADAANNGRTVEASPIESNPFHADICLNLPDEGNRRDLQKEHSVDLAARASWENAP